MENKRLKKTVIVCGRICSGKTYISNIIFEKTKFPVASFGGYLKYYCIKNNLPTDRKTLQDTGEKLIETMPRQFLNDVIDYFIGSSDTLVIEGVRHISIFKLINELSEVIIPIFIEADQQTRYTRYNNRKKESDLSKTFEQFVILDNHPVEMETQNMKSLCKITIDSTKPFDENLFDFILG